MDNTWGRIVKIRLDAATLVPQGVVVTAAEHVWVMRRAIGNGPLLVYEVKPGRVWLRPKSSTQACS